MDVLLKGYSVSQETWFYLSTLLIIAVFFRFNRFWSLRNLDLVLLLLSAPGLLLVNKLAEPFWGYVWLFAVSGLYLARLLADPILQRRPQLGQNLNAGGLIFLCASAFVFLATKAITDTLPASTAVTVEHTKALINRESRPEPPEVKSEPAPGPAATLLAAPVEFVFEDLAARILSILTHGAVVAGLIVAGKKLFGDVHLGLASSTLYMLLPGTAYSVGSFNHVLPSALIVWAIVFYRSPIVAGVFLGLASGAMFFPVFLLPLWFVFYGRNGRWRFSVALAGVALVLVGSLALTSRDGPTFVNKILGSIDLEVLAFRSDEKIEGFWNGLGYLSFYRLPVIALYCIQLALLTWLPRQKTVEHLLAHSTAIILSTQFWYTQQGGTYLLWYLPMLLMVVFRPRLLHLVPPDQSIDDNASAIRDRAATDSAPTLGSVRSQLYR
jgi:hypothetical protein